MKQDVEVAEISQMQEQALLLQITSSKLLLSKAIDSSQAIFYMIWTIFVTDLFFSSVLSLSQIKHDRFFPLDSGIVVFSNIVSHLLFILITVQVAQIFEVSFIAKTKQAQGKKSSEQQ